MYVKRFIIRNQLIELQRWETSRVGRVNWQTGNPGMLLVQFQSESENLRSHGAAGIHFSLKANRHKTLFSSVQSLSHVRLFATPWIAPCQASLSITNSRSLLKLKSIELVMPSNHLILCHSFLLLPSILPSIRVFSNESVLCITWPKYQSFSLTPVLPMNIQD